MFSLDQIEKLHILVIREEPNQECMADFATLVPCSRQIMTQVAEFFLANNLESACNVVVNVRKNRKAD